MQPRPRRITYEQIRPSSQGASFSVRRFAEAGVFPFLWHFHPEVELTLIVRGRAMKFVGDAIERSVDGDLVLLGANLPHTWASDKGCNDCSSIVIQFLPNFWGERFNALPEMRQVMHLLDRARYGLVFTGRARDEVADLMHQAADAQPVDQLWLLIRMLARLSRVTDARPLSRSDATRHGQLNVSRRMRRVLDRLHADIVELPSQRELAADIGMSPQAFSRFFRRQVGKPFVQYVNEWRVGLACRNLLETDDSITDVALGSGFDNLSNFNRQFKRIVGVTPSEYRSRTGEKHQAR